MGEKKYKVAVVGATGMVGEAMLEILEDRNFPVSEVLLLASERSRGRILTYRGEEMPVGVLKDDSFKGVDVALFSAGGSISQRFVPAAVKAGAICIDNTSAFRMDPSVPLVVPEVNGEAARDHQGIIANPNCSTIQMVLVLKPIHDAAGVVRVVVSSYQAVSGAGRPALEEMLHQTRALLDGGDLTPEVFPRQIAFNCLPHIDVFLENGYTREEMKMTNETMKIMGDESVKVTATCVRVPAETGHSEAVNIETGRKMEVGEVREVLAVAPGVGLMDDPEKLVYPTAIDAAGSDITLVGRIREDESIANGINLWIVSDNLRKGAALNAVQIAEFLVGEDLI
jgi:aspartate-semialdehyde dehydrogenase